MLATEYASYYGITPQAEGESDMDFRSRVATELRQQDHVIAAHEAYHNSYWDTGDPAGENVMTGIIGAVAQAMQGTHYRGDPIGNDIAAGVVTQHPKEQMSPEIALLAVMIFG